MDIFWIHVDVLTYLDSCGYNRIPTDSCGYDRISTDSCGFMWMRQDFYGCLLIHVDAKRFKTHAYTNRFYECMIIPLLRKGTCCTNGFLYIDADTNGFFMRVSRGACGSDRIHQ